MLDLAQKWCGEKVLGETSVNRSVTRQKVRLIGQEDRESSVFSAKKIRREVFSAVIGGYRESLDPNHDQRDVIRLCFMSGNNFARKDTFANL